MYISTQGWRLVLDAVEFESPKIGESDPAPWASWIDVGTVSVSGYKLKSRVDQYA